MNRKLGKNQRALLLALVRHDGTWGNHTAWVWGTTYQTVELLRSLQRQGLVKDASVVVDGHKRVRFDITPEGREVANLDRVFGRAS